MTDYIEMAPLELIEEYGRQCHEGGMGYAFADSDTVLDEIKKRLDEAGLK